MMDQTGGLYISIPGTVLYSTVVHPVPGTVLYCINSPGTPVLYCTVLYCTV